MQHADKGTPSTQPDGTGLRIGIVQARFNESITNALAQACRATLEEEHALDLRTRDLERKMLKKVEAALVRIEDGSYGYCEETGEPISLKRLDARPIATLSIEAQERHERRERVHRDD